MHKKRCPRCGFNHTKKMENGIENRDINAMIVDSFLGIIAGILQY